MSSTRTIKVALVGAEAVGKTTIARQFINHTFTANRVPTNLFDYGHRRVTFKEHDTILDIDSDEDHLYQLWDCGSSELAQQVCRSYLMQCDIVLAVYDCTRKETFETAKELALAAQEENARAVVVLVGNKEDLNASAQVSRAQGEEWVRDRKMTFMSCVASRYLSVEGIIRLAAAHLPPVLPAARQIPVTLEQVVRGASKTTSVALCCVVV